jgi:predicted ATP-grasp superfamily ATP-dependent carboligase
VLKLPENVNWKILGNIKYHQRLISIFGINRFIDIPIYQLHEYIKKNNEPFNFLKDIPEKSIIIPTDFESLRFLSKNKHSFPGHSVCPLMEEDMLNYLDDKSNQKEIVANCKILSPKEYIYPELKNLPNNQCFVIKPSLASASYGVFISKNCQQAIKHYESLTPENKNTHIIQDYIVGDDYFYYAICFKGEVYLSAIIKPGCLPGRFRYFGTVFINNPSVSEIAEKIICYYNYSGPISIDFRIAKESKKIYLIEINPRNGSNFYFLGVVNVNWLLELAKVSENPDGYDKKYSVTSNSKWFSSFKLTLLDIFLKLKYIIT